MIVTEKYLRSYIRKLLESSIYDSSHGWYASDDSDWPAPTGSPFDSSLRSRYAIFIDKPEDYSLDSKLMSHGGYSHALKHAYEIYPGKVLKVLEKISKYVSNLGKTGRELYRVSKKDGQSQPFRAGSIKPGDILNTLDWINDTSYSGKKLPIHYERMYRMSKVIYELYYDSLRETRSKAIDVSDEVFDSIEDLRDFLKTNPVIKFEASFKGKPASLRILDTSNSVLFGMSPDEKISTYFMQEKKKKKHSLKRSLSFVAPIKKDGSPSATMITDKYSNLRKIAAMAVKGDLQ